MFTTAKCPSHNKTINIMINATHVEMSSPGIINPSDDDVGPKHVSVVGQAETNPTPSLYVHLEDNFFIIVIPVHDIIPLPVG